ncbi:MAG: twin-arginine translocase subunit TatC [Chloroflexota bacterium]|nr:MAG: twin-arginine translocase subunit TatC [Chloroflexota bacterium]
MRKFLRNFWRGLTFPFRAAGSAFGRLQRFITEEPEDTPLPDVVSKSLSNVEGIFFHLDILRRHLLRSVIALAITTAFSFAFTPRLIDFLAKPIGGIETLVPIEVTEPIGVFMRVALLFGFALALPYIVFEMWLFAAPGLRPKSRIFALVALPLVVLFFIGGMAFAYGVMLPTALPFLLNFLDMRTQVRPASYISFVSGLMFWVGAVFEFPFIIFILASLGLVRGEMLAKQWRIAIVIIAVVAAAITPTVDPVSMSLVMGPMIILYFLSIGLAYIAQRGRAAPQTAG